jgi:hypothetical protein
MKNLINIIKDYMSDKFNIDLSLSDTEENTRKIFLTVMTDVNNMSQNQDKSLQDTNIQVLAKVKDYYCSKLNLTNTGANLKKPNIQNLTREQTIYGDRPLKQNIIIPEQNPYFKRDDTQNTNDRISIEKILSERNDDVNPKKVIPDFNTIANVTKETSQNQDEFIKKLQDLQNERNKIQFENLNVNKADIDPAVLYRTVQKNDDSNTNTYTNSFTDQNKINKDITIRNQSFTDGVENFIIPKKNDNLIIEKYLSVNSIDRDWANGLAPLRYRYGINFLTKNNDLMNKYKNIDSIKVGRVIIPCEELPISNNYHINFSYPYVILSIDEFNDVYDGTNDTIRRSFCNLIYESSYRSPNGRGYIVLRPVQDEKKQFYPAPLSTIQKLSISLLQPNGELLSNCQDSYQILSIQDLNPNDPNKLLVTLSAYFKPIDLFDLDNILIQNFAITQLVPQQLISDLNSLNEFINRSSGHQIISLGSPNASGYYNQFYISAPYTFNKSTGTNSIQAALINCLDLYNLNNTSTIPNGILLNQSLQHSISFKVDTIVDNAKILDVQNVFGF